MTGFQRLCLVTCAVIFGLIVLGGVVRATDSGLGCPDWPRCHGSFIPRWEFHTLVEYSHRLTASVAGFLVLGLAVWSWRSFRRTPAILYPSLGALVLIVVQAGLGGAAVLNELPPEIVAVHLGVALLILTLLVLVTTASFSTTRDMLMPDSSPGFGRLAATASATTLLLMLAGSYVSGAEYGLACGGWPLCNGELVPSVSSTSVQVHFLHRLLALVVGLVLLALVWLGFRERSRSLVAWRLTAGAFGVYLVQALIGAANVWTELSDPVGAVHLGVGTLLWLTLALLNIRVHRLHELLPATAPDRPVSSLAGAPR